VATRATGASTGQRFGAAGTKLGAEFLVNTTTVGSRFKPVVSV
jgi:hypothetical protein